jgi:hypothetical protein
VAAECLPVEVIAIVLLGGESTVCALEAPAEAARAAALALSSALYLRAPTWV